MIEPKPVLVDSSVWVCYLRASGWQELKEELKRPLAVGRVASCWPIIMEVLVGARDEDAYIHLSELLGSLPLVSVDESGWKDAAQLGYTLRRRGFSIPLPDLLIAQAAIQSDFVLWHVDAHFEQVRRFSPLRTRSFLVNAT